MRIRNPLPSEAQHPTLSVMDSELCTSRTPETILLDSGLFGMNPLPQTPCIPEWSKDQT